MPHNSTVLFFLVASIVLNIFLLLLFQRYLVNRQENENNQEIIFNNECEYSAKIMSYPLEWKSTFLLFLSMLGTYTLINTQIIFFYSVLFLPIICFFIYYNNIRKIEITEKSINLFKYSLGSETLIQDFLFEDIRGVKFIYKKNILGKIWSAFNQRDIVILLNNNQSYTISNSSKNIASIIFDFLELKQKPIIIVLKSTYPNYEKRVKTISELVKLLNIK